MAVSNARRPGKVGMITLGCPKNLVDSEVMLGALHSAGYSVVSDLEGADLVVINTCAFITDAQQESIDAILEAARLKTEGKVGRLLVAGCLPQRHGLPLLEQMPEIDYLLGPGAIGRVVEVADRLLQGDLEPGAVLDGLDRLDYDWRPRVLSGHRHTAYLKVSEGCGHHCAYCVIPRLRGPQRSRPLEDLEEEARWLAEAGVAELTVIAQDTSAYGADLYGRPSLDRLLQRLDAVDGFRWIRVLYCDPRSWTPGLLEMFAGARRLVPYVDMPIQHASDSVLRRMGRGMKWDSIRRILEDLRRILPGVSLRTTVITGFPGETGEDFRFLLQALREYEFDHLGAFAYSEEDGTPAAGLDGQVAVELREERREQVLLQQREISLARNRRRMGEFLEVLVDSIDTDRGILRGRWAGQALDIDGTVIAVPEWASRGRPWSGRTGPGPGDFLQVRVRGAGPYDLVGSVEKERNP